MLNLKQIPELQQQFRIFSLFFLIAGYNIVTGGYFTAVEEPISATVISLGRSAVLLILSLGVLTMLFSGAGIWWSPMTSEALTLTLLLLIAYKKMHFYSCRFPSRY